MTVLAMLWHHDGRPAARACSAMLEAQRSENRDGAVRDCGPIALGKICDNLLAEDGCESGPVEGAGGALTLIADVRLDNRADLAARLGLASAAMPGISDTRLMMHCLERWGDRAIDDFVGDFALALWDRRSEQLILARDYSGQRPLYFHASGRSLAAASTARGLHALDFVPRGVNEMRMLELLAPLPQEGRTSFFEGIERVEPGEALTFRRGGRASRICWRPPADPIRLGSPDDYAEALTEKLDAAVEARLRGVGGAVGTHLSAGLDSSAVTTSAALQSRGRVVAFTSVPSGSLPTLPSGRFGNEAALAAETAAMYPNIEHHLVPVGTRLPLEDLGRELETFERPDLNLPNLVWSNRINDVAKAAGIKVMLTGTMGNATISYDGPEVIDDLLAQRGMRGFAKAWAAAPKGRLGARIMIGAAARHYLPPGLVQVLRRARNRDEHPIKGGVMNRSATGAAEIMARYEALEAGGFPNSVDTRLEMIRRVDQASFDKGVLRRWNIDIRDPTTDRRLVEFCLQVPSDQYFRDGTRRALIRNALKGRVPESVRCSELRGLQTANWFSLLSAARPEAREILERIAGSPVARRILDIEKMRRLLDDWPLSPDGAGPPVYRTGLLRGLSIGEFIRLHSSSGDA